MKTRVLAAVLLLASVSVQAEPVTAPAAAAPLPRLAQFFADALGTETLLQFSQCTSDARDFVFDVNFSYLIAEQSVTVGCLDERGEPNSTAIRLSRYNAGKPVPTEIVMVDIAPDIYQLWRGRPAVGNNDYLVGELSADTARAAIAAAAARVRADQALARARAAAEEFPGPCP